MSEPTYQVDSYGRTYGPRGSSFGWTGCLKGVPHHLVERQYLSARAALHEAAMQLRVTNEATGAAKFVSIHDLGKAAPWESPYPEEAEENSENPADKA